MCSLALPPLVIVNGDISSNRINLFFSVVLFLRCVNSIIRITEPGAKGIIWITGWWPECDLLGCYKQAIETLNAEWLPAFCTLQYPFSYAKRSVNPICQELGMSKARKGSIKLESARKEAEYKKRGRIMTTLAGEPKRIVIGLNSASDENDLAKILIVGLCPRPINSELQRVGLWQ